MIKGNLVLGYVDGLPGVLPPAACTLKFGERELVVTSSIFPGGGEGVALLLTKGREKGLQGSSMMEQLIDQTFRLPYERILSIDTLTRNSIATKNKSVVGRGITGGLLFGAAGMLFGGLSGIGTKQTLSLQSILAISYVDKSEEIKNISLDIGKMAMEVQDFVDTFNKEYRQEIM